MKKNLFLAALALVALASCTDSDFVGDTSPDVGQNEQGAIVFNSNTNAITRAGEFTGATAAEKLGRMFVVEGTKGSEQTTSPSTTVVFDNYLVGYTYNTAATTESNTNNWEYVNLEKTGITDRMTPATWTALHTVTAPATAAQAQTIKYWDYDTNQYDFIAWSTGTCEAIPVPAEEAAPASGKIQVSRINQVTTTAPTGFTMRAARVEDLKQCYYTDINTVLRASYGTPVTLTFRNMTATVRVALYETIPGYSVKDVEFYQDETTTLGTQNNPATLYTTGDNKLPQSGKVTVLYPRVGTNNSSAVDHNKASVTVAADASTAVTKQEFGPLTSQYTGKDPSGHEAEGNIYLGRTLPNATFAGSNANSFYKDVIPNTAGGTVLTLRLNYKLVSTDGSGETITVYGAKAVVPAIYTKWLPNYAYTYIFKISDNSNGWTTATTVNQPNPGLFPITFDAMVTSFVDANAEQTTVTTVATPSITTYQQGHNTGTDGVYTVPDEYKNNGAKLYVKVMNNGTAVTGLSNTNSLFFKIEKNSADYIASEAEVMDALENHAPDYAYDATSPVGRNGITLTAQTNTGDNLVINNSATSIVNGVDNQPVSVSSGEVAEINLAGLTGTFAYVYVSTAATADEKIYNVVPVANDTDAKKYYFVNRNSITAETATDDKAVADKVYFVRNTDAAGGSVTYTFKQTKVGDSVAGLYEASISADKATSYTADNFYFDVYNQNKGAYAVKVIKVVAGS